MGPASTGEAHLLPLAAVLGERFRLDHLAVVAGEKPSQVLATCERLVAAGRLARTPEGYAFATKDAHGWVLHDAPSSARAALHRQVAERLADSGHPPERLVEHVLACLRLGADQAVPLVCRFADALTGLTPRDAVAMLDTARAIATQPAQRAVLTAAVVRPLLMAGEVTRAAQEASYALDAGASAAVVGDRSHVLYLAGRTEEAIAHADRLLSSSELRPAERAALAARRAFYANADDPGAVERLAEHALESAPDDETTAVAHLALASAARARSDPARAVGEARRAIELCHAVEGNRVAGWQPHLVLAAALFELDRLHDAQSALARGLRLAHDVGASWQVPVHLTVRGMVGYLAGSWRAAADDAREAVAAADATGVAVNRPAALALGAVIASARSEAAEAERLLRRAESDVAATRSAAVQWARTACALDAGDRAAAGAHAASSAASWAASGTLPAPHQVLEAVLAGVIAEVDAPARVVADTRIPSGTTSWTAVRLVCEALLTGDGRLASDAVTCARDAEPLAVLVGVLEAAGRQQLETSPASATALLDEARQMLLTWGATGRAARLEGLIRTSAASPGTPRIGWSAVTPAEAAVLELLIRGLPNGDIAAELVLSKRTVESHVSSLLRKLQARTRVELVRTALSHPQ